LWGGEFARINIYTGSAFGGAFFVHRVVLRIDVGAGGARKTAGQRWTNLKLINFDGSPIDRRERGHPVRGGVPQASVQSVLA